MMDYDGNGKQKSKAERKRAVRPNQECYSYKGKVIYGEMKSSLHRKHKIGNYVCAFKMQG